MFPSNICNSDYHTLLRKTILGSSQFGDSDACGRSRGGLHIHRAGCRVGLGTARPGGQADVRCGRWPETGGVVSPRTAATQNRYHRPANWDLLSSRTPLPGPTTRERRTGTRSSEALNLKGPGPGRPGRRPVPVTGPAAGESCGAHTVAAGRRPAAWLGLTPARIRRRVRVRPEGPP